MRLSICSWRTLDRWGGSTLASQTLAFPTERLGVLATLREECIADIAHGTAWPSLGIRFNGEVVARPEETHPRGAVFAARRGDVLVSRIDVRNGAVGIVPREIEGGRVTNEYPVLTVDPTRLDASFLVAFLRSRYGRNAIDARVSGTSGRKRLAGAELLNLAIPLPPLAAQRKLVTALHTADVSARALESAAAQTLSMMADALERESVPVKRRTGAGSQLRVARYLSLERWAAHSQASVDVPESCAVRVVPLERLVGGFEAGWSPQCEPRPSADGEWGVLKVSAVSRGQFEQSENKALPRDLTPIPALEVRDGDILICRANTLQFVGMCAEVRRSRRHLMLSDKLLRVRAIDSTTLMPAFLPLALRTQFARAQVERLATGTSPSMKNISQQALLSIRIPVPSPEVQRRLIASARQADDADRSARVEAARLRIAAAAEFERSLLVDEQAARTA